MNFRHARQWLDEHFESDDSRAKPFFLYYAANSNHSPYTPSDTVDGLPVKGQGRFVDGSVPPLRGLSASAVRDEEMKNTVERLDFIYENDLAVDRLLHYLESHDDPRRSGHKLLDNTLFIFTSDNGSEMGGRVSVGPLRGKKATIYEGGHRVPFLAMWPARGVGDGDPDTGGITSRATFGLNDMFASLAALTGQPLPPPDQGAEDSHNVLPALLAEELEPGGRGWLVQHDDYNMGPALAIRDGEWKLIVSSQLVEKGVLEPIALFDLASNLEEKEDDNLIASPGHQQRVTQMSERLTEIYTDGHSR
jgi:arylsulfatase A-like enzyme